MYFGHNHVKLLTKQTVFDLDTETVSLQAQGISFKYPSISWIINEKVCFVSIFYRVMSKYMIEHFKNEL